MGNEGKIREVIDQTQGRDFLFSVVIPAYKTEEYLGEAIESILTQTLSFEENIQLILVNDGSPDNSLTVCRAYQDQFPQNIVVIDQENAGASPARRIGLAYARGAYVNFLDSDDCWSETAFQRAAEFFAANPSVSITTARHSFFGGNSTPYHALAYKYDMDKIVDIRTMPDHPLLTLSNSFVARSLFDESFFDERLRVSEDFLVINEILLREYCYGVMSEPTYYYRKRDFADSAIDTNVHNRSWYLDTPQYCYKRLFELSRERFGSVIPYIQYCIMYDLQWRIEVAEKCRFGEDVTKPYEALVVELLQDIEPEIIMTQRDLLSNAGYVYALALKYGVSFSEIQQHMSVVGKTLYWDSPQLGHKLVIAPLEEDAKLTVEFMYSKDGQIVIEGCLKTVAAIDNVRVTALTASNVTCEGIIEYNHCYEQHGFQGETYFVPLKYSLTVPPETFSLFVSIHGMSWRAELNLNKYSPLRPVAGSYALLGDHILTCAYPYTEVEVAPATRQGLVRRESLSELRTFVNNHEYASYLKHRRNAFTRRLAGGKRIWLFSDRTDLANDNGEALFTYLQEHPIEGVETYFILREDSIDYERMKKIGNVVPYRSGRHFSLFLQAEVVISSSADEYVSNPFDDALDYMAGFPRPQFVFLQHGVILHDLSSWLFRYEKDIDLFITSAPRERDSIVNNPRYGYNADTVVCTGLPRHDKLLRLAQNNQKRRILIAPTWRNTLAMAIDIRTSLRDPNPHFEESEYFRFFDALLNDARLAAAAQETGYEVRFLIHPCFMQEINKFKSSFATIVADYHYADELSSASILLSDYSSVVFDFALLKRPVIYAQFDRETFYEGQVYTEGYFDYEQDGFGPVCTSYEETIDALLEAMDSHVMPEKYAQRAESFFYWPERPRCELVVEAIEDMLNHSSEDKPQIF